jgi:signal transduction histidine kinase
MTTKSSHEELERRVQALETKNTQLVKNLHEARSLSEEVMTYMSEGLVITDTSASIMFINKSLSEMLGYLLESTEFLTLSSLLKNLSSVENRFHILPTNSRFDFQTIPFVSRRDLPVYIPFGASR